MALNGAFPLYMICRIFQQYYRPTHHCDLMGPQLLIKMTLLSHPSLLSGILGLGCWTLKGLMGGALEDHQSAQFSSDLSAIYHPGFYQPCKRNIELWCPGGSWCFGSILYYSFLHPCEFSVNKNQTYHATYWATPMSSQDQRNGRHSCSYQSFFKAVIWPWLG